MNKLDPIPNSMTNERHKKLLVPRQ